MYAILKTTWNANSAGWTHSHLGEIWIYNEGIRSSLRNSEPGGGYYFVGCTAVANQLAAAWMWLAGAIPLSTVHTNSLLYFMLFYETHELVWEIISFFWKENEKLYLLWKLLTMFSKKNDEGGLFPLTHKVNIRILRESMKITCVCDSQSPRGKRLPPPPSPNSLEESLTHIQTQYIHWASIKVYIKFAEE